MPIKIYKKTEPIPTPAAGEIAIVVTLSTATLNDVVNVTPEPLRPPKHRLLCALSLAAQAITDATNGERTTDAALDAQIQAVTTRAAEIKRNRLEGTALDQ
jgi:hypothetical protein